MNVNVLHRDLLLSLAPMPVQALQKHSISAGELIGLAQVLAPAFEGLLPGHGAPVAVHRGVVGGDQLRRHHALQLVLRTDALRHRSPARTSSPTISTVCFAVCV